MTLVDTAAASAGTGIPIRTLQRWIRQGRLVNYGTTRRYRIDLLALQEIMALDMWQIERSAPNSQEDTCTPGT